jgi:hypothetical protein
VSPAALLLAIIAAFYGWQAFSDGPLAHYVLEGMLLAVLLAKIALDNGRGWFAVCGFGALLGLLQAGCGVFYRWDSADFVCDTTTGRPVSMVVAIGAVLVGVSLIRGGK